MSPGAEPRTGLRDVAPYVSTQLDVAARLNTNESPHPLPEGFFEELAAAVRELPLHRYPDAQMTRLRAELGESTGHPVEGIWAANGSNEILTQLLQAYGGPGRAAVTFEPTYVLHERLCWLTHTENRKLSLPRDFVLGEPQVAAAVDLSPEVAFVCSPNNPTGNAQPLSSIAALAQALPESLVLVDEAYVEFAPAGSAQALVTSYPNVVVVRTFSKAFALAGARIGYVLAVPAVVEDLQRVRLPYHLSALTQTAGIVALRHRADAATVVGAIRIQRDRITRELRSLPDVAVYPSDANFVLFVPPGDATALWHGLLEHGVLVRDMTSVVPNALRVTAGAEHETDLFLKAITEVLAG
ncbi:MAG: histidinol-phosphate transaminase [Actinomycetota bacterium]